MTTTEPRVWIGCLACYNGGQLVGEWYDATEADEVTTEQLHDGVDNLRRAELRTSFGASPHEELWVMDHENFGGMLTGECSPSEAARLARLLGEVPEASRGAFAAFLGYHRLTADDNAVEAFEDAYRGECDSTAYFAQDFAEEIGAVTDGDAAWPHTCIDWQRAWRDLELGGDFYALDNLDGGVWIFSN